MGNGQNVTNQVVWRSSNPAVATVDEEGGLAFGMAPGVVKVFATWPGSSVSGSASLSVSTPAATPSPAVLVEVVNDTNQADGSVTFDGNALSTQSVFTNAGTWVSPYTGQTRQIYAVTIDNGASGHLNVTMPTGRSTFVEYGVPGDWDLTLINTFSIPMQLDVFNGTDGTVATRTVYQSTPTILSLINGLSADMGAAILNSSGSPNYNFNDDPTLADFGHVNGPQNILSGSNDDPSPWPSFTQYLNKVSSLPLRPDGSQFSIAYNQNNGYDYTAVCQAGASGYTITMQPTANAYSPMVVSLPNTALNFFIYAAPCGTGAGGAVPFYVGGNPGPPGQCGTLYESAYDSVVSALNFGYLTGKYTNEVVTGPGGEPINSWYAHPPTSIPGPGARVTNDGFYNPWAALMYNVSDNYGYVYGDREGRLNPQIQVNPNNTIFPTVASSAPTRKVRVTLLNDFRLDMPLVTSVTPTGNSIALNWKAIKDACGYTVTWSPPFSNPGSAVVNTPGYTITGLKPGVSYLIRVRADGASPFNSGVPVVHSFALSTSATTTGSAAAGPMIFPSPAPAGSTTVSFNLQLAWAIPWVPLPSNLVINGTSSSVNTGVSVNGTAGPSGSPVENDYTFSFTDYQGNTHSETVVLMLEQSGGKFTITGVGTNGIPYYSGMSCPASSFMAGSERSAGANASLTLGGDAAWPFDNNLVVEIQYDPVPAKKFLPVVFPSPVP